MEKRMMVTPSEFRADEQDSKKHIAGYFVVFGDTYKMPDGTEERIDRHALDDTIGGDVRCLTNHDTRLVLGRTGAGTMTMRIDDHGVWGDVIINEMDSDALNTWARVQRGDVSQASFGFDIVAEHPELMDNGRTRWVVDKLNLLEWSVCTFPAYESTQLQAREARQQETKRSAVEAWRIEQQRRLRSHEA